MITKELVKAYRKQTKKYFDSELMDMDCEICKAVPSYIEYQKSDKDLSDAACIDCPLYEREFFTSCMYHRTFIDEGNRKDADKDVLLARGNYLKQMGEKAGIPMEGIGE